MKRIFASLLMASLASLASAEEIRSVLIWHDTDRAPVQDNAHLDDSTQVQVFDMAIQRKVESRINNDLKARGLTFGPDMSSNRAQSKDALRAYMSTEDFRSVGRQLNAFGYGLNAAMQYRIDRVPSILLNERYLVVGVNSLGEAIRIFQREVK